MNIAIWILAGCAIGWLGYIVFHDHERHGVLATLTIGVLGGLLGGMTLAPMLADVIDTTSPFNPFSPMIPLAVAATCLTISNLLSHSLPVGHPPA